VSTGIGFDVSHIKPQNAEFRHLESSARDCSALVKLRRPKLSARAWHPIVIKTLFYPADLGHHAASSLATLWVINGNDSEKVAPRPLPPPSTLRSPP
jgi:hypothetical protein